MTPTNNTNPQPPVPNRLDALFDASYGMDGQVTLMIDDRNSVTVSHPVWVGIRNKIARHYQPPVPEGLDDIRMTIYFTERQLDDLKPGQEIELELTDDARKQVLAWHNAHQPKPQPVSGDVEEIENGIQKIIELVNRPVFYPRSEERNAKVEKAIRGIIQAHTNAHLTQFKERAVEELKKSNETYGIKDYAFKKAAEAIRKI